MLVSCVEDPRPDRLTPSPVPNTPAALGSFELVGHEPLFGRGMNAALAVYDGYAYVGSRTDGSEGHEHAGVLVVDIRDPTKPTVVHEIGPPDEGIAGETSRELRVWPSQHLLIVLNFPCDPGPHDCVSGRDESMVRFYDIGGTRAKEPVLIAVYRPSLPPHEFFLWVDPEDSGRAVIYMSSPSPYGDQLLVTDISGARDGRFEELATWQGEFPDPGANDALHSLSVSEDGTRAYLAYLTAGFLVMDTADIAKGIKDPDLQLVTPVTARVQWGGWGVHSVIKIPGRELALTTDEVYGASEPGGGCPWGWARLIDIAHEETPRVLSEYRVFPFNDPAGCSDIDGDTNRNASFSSHNPTATSHIAFVTWHSAGLQAFTTDRPLKPQTAAQFIPQPLAKVTTEDPALSSGPAKVVMWSYPIISDGLIYVVDIRNGLYVLRYRGPFEDEVHQTAFLEGNSNVGRASYG